MKKILEHRDTKISIKVELNALAEKRINGLRTHHVIVKDICGGVYYKKYEIDSNSNLEDEIMSIEVATKKAIDKIIEGNPKSEDEKILISLGYK